MGAVLLDTTVVIDVLNGRRTSVQRLDALERIGDTPYICAITVEEVTNGLHPREREDATHLLEGLAIAPLGMEEGRIAGWWRRDLRRKGQTIAQADALIAAAAFQLGAPLATGNPKDFPLKEVTVQHWPAGQ